MSEKQCPVCHQVLDIGHKSGLTTWACPDTHGVFVDLAEAYNHLQRDELAAIWAGTEEAPRSRLLSPIDGKPMIEVTFTVDDDLDVGEDSDTARPMTIEVDVDNYFGWFSFAELRSMPTGRGPDRSRTVSRSAPVETSASMVTADQMDQGTDEYDHFFDNLTEADYEDQPEDRSIGGLLSGLGRRLRS